MYYVGLEAGGPPAIWSSWLITIVCSCITAAMLAEVCSSIPLSGSIYIWAAECGGQKYGRLAGFIVAFWVSVAANPDLEASSPFHPLTYSNILRSVDYRMDLFPCWDQPGNHKLPAVGVDRLQCRRQVPRWHTRHYQREGKGDRLGYLRVLPLHRGPRQLYSS